MHEALFPPLDFLNGGHCHPRGLCRTQSRNGIRCAVSIGAVPCAGRLACRHQCDAAFLRAVPQDPECGTGAVTYAESAGGARRKNYDVPQGEIPHRAYRLRRRGRGKRTYFRRFRCGCAENGLRSVAGRLRFSQKEKKTALPPKLFDLTLLQREANRVYGFTAKQTLDYAQSLYESVF